MPQMSANPKPSHGESVASKDVTINPQTKVWLRMYLPSKLPSNDRCVARLPILVYFHSGGFINYSVSSVFCHERCNQYSREMPAIVLALEYRLAPEHKLPAQYDDAIDLFVWIQNQSKPDGDNWLRDYADFSRCYLLGRDSGANIIYNASLRAIDLDLRPLKIAGIILNQPMVGGMQRTRSELKYACDEIVPLPCWDLMWELALPKGADRDHRYSNPMKDAAQKSKVKELGRCLVIGYGMDPMVDRQQELVTMLVSNGAKVEAHFDEVGFHGIDIVDPKRAAYTLQLVKDFVNY